MRTIFWLSFLVVATANGDTLTGVNVQSGEVSQDSATPAEYSRVNQEVYKAFATPVRQSGNKNSHITPPPIPKFPSPPTRSVVQTVSVTPKSIKASKPLQAIPHKISSAAKKTDDDDRHLTYRIRTYSNPEENSAPESDDSDLNCDDDNESDSDPVEYQPKEYPVAPTSPTYPPQPVVYTQQPQVYAQQPAVYAQQPAIYAQQPSVYAQQPSIYAQQPSVYAQQPSVYAQLPSIYAQQPAVYAQQPPVYRRQPAVYRAYGSPLRRGFVYRRPFYAGVLKAASPVYRSLEYTRPVAYALPISSIRRITYDPAAVRYVQRPSLAYEGIGGLDYDNLLNVDYNELKK